MKSGLRFESLHCTCRCIVVQKPAYHLKNGEKKYLKKNLHIYVNIKLIWNYKIMQIVDIMMTIIFLLNKWLNPIYPHHSLSRLSLVTAWVEGVNDIACYCSGPTIIPVPARYWTIYTQKTNNQNGGTVLTHDYLLLCFFFLFLTNQSENRPWRINTKKLMCYIILRIIWGDRRIKI